MCRSFPGSPDTRTAEALCTPADNDHCESIIQPRRAARLSLSFDDRNFLLPCFLCNARADERASFPFPPRERDIVDKFTARRKNRANRADGRETSLSRGNLVIRRDARQAKGNTFNSRLARPRQARSLYRGQLCKFLIRELRARAPGLYSVTVASTLYRRR